MFPLDITRIINDQIAIYPGDPPYKQKFHCKLPQDELNFSSISMGVHTGTHVDAPFHFLETGKKITDIPLLQFQGPSLVIDLAEIPVEGEIRSHHLEQFDIKPREIILFKTQNSYIPPIDFKPKKIILSPCGAKYLIEKETKAVGIDYLSIGDIKVHKLLLEHEILIYENLDLYNIIPQRYFFCGFPLKIEGVEGSPVRAVLFNLS